MKYYFQLFIAFAIVVFFIGCASMEVVGREPAERAISAAELLLEGKIDDSYIKVFKDEFSKAELEINDLVERSRYDEMAYVDIADDIYNWIALYDRIKRLQELYPNGLQGKKDSVFFEYIDYNYLIAEAPVKATEALYTEGQKINMQSGNNFEQRLTALDYLQRAKNYSDHLNIEINALGADICYTVAEKIASSNNPEDFVHAADLYLESTNWIPNYKDATNKIPELTEKAVSIYIAQGEAQLALENYTAFRQARDAFEKAENIISGSAQSNLKAVNDLLSVTLVVLFTGDSSIYPDEDAVTRALQEKIRNNSQGPRNLEVQFKHIIGTSDVLLLNLDDADLILLPDDDFGTVSEDVVSRKETTNIQETIEGVQYLGTLIEQNQEVTVFFKNNATLYGARENWKSISKIFEEEAQKTTKIFTTMTYTGDVNVIPQNFDSGVAYTPESRATMFPDFRQAPSAYALIKENNGTLNILGNEICSIIGNLSYTN